MAHIFIIDDEVDLVRFVRRALEAEGHRVSAAYDGAAGLAEILTSSPDLLVLDLLMPGIDGHAVLAALMSTRRDARVLVLSAAADVRARVDVLEAGAVDFLAKPFALRELIARVNNALRQTPGRTEDVLTVRDAALDVRARTLRVDGHDVNLSQREFMLLLHLMRHSGKVCSRAELLAEVWGYNFDPSTNVVDVCVRRLRRKLQRDLIHTVRNVGYQLEIG